MISELVPLATRVQSLVALRATIVLAVLLARFAVPDLVTGDGTRLLSASLVYLSIVILAELIRRIRGQGLELLAATLLLDGLYLAWVVRATGGAESVLRDLVVLHLIAVTLLASYRTGLKLALWDTMLLFVLSEARVEGTLTGGYRALIAFTVAFWLVAIGAATFSAVNERELRRRRADLESLHEFGVALDHARRPVEVAEVTLEHASVVIGLRDGVVLGYRAAGPVVLVGPGAGTQETIRLGPDSVVRRAWEGHEPVLSHELDAEDDPWLAQALPGVMNLVVLPMFADGQPAGAVVGVFGPMRHQRVERRVLSTATQLSAHAALALRNAWLLEDVEQLAATDSLTRLANRRHLEEALDRELDRVGGGRGELSFVIVDLDRFKRLNDTHGHQVGDDVLRRVGRVLIDSVPSGATVARYGGEEFAVVLPCGTAEAVAAAERLRIAIAAMAGPVPITASFGVATYPTDAVDRAELVSGADQALYESKRQGRNRVSSAQRRSSGWLDLPWAREKSPAPT